MTRFVGGPLDGQARLTTGATASRCLIVAPMTCEEPSARYAITADGLTAYFTGYDWQ